MPFTMSEDPEFRAQFMREQNRRVFEMQEALDKSTVEDLVSYKIKDDKHKNLLTFDDLRLQQIMVANQLRSL